MTEKEIVVYHTLLYIRLNKDIDKKKAKEVLLILAKKYRVNLRAIRFKIELNVATESFIINSKGYINTIPDLYYGLE